MRVTANRYRAESRAAPSAYGASAALVCVFAFILQACFGGAVTGLHGDEQDPVLTVGRMSGFPVFGAGQEDRSGYQLILWPDGLVVFEDQGTLMLGQIPDVEVRGLVRRLQGSGFFEPVNEQGVRGFGMVDAPLRSMTFNGERRFIDAHPELRGSEERSRFIQTWLGLWGEVQAILPDDVVPLEHHVNGRGRYRGFEYREGLGLPLR